MAACGGVGFEAFEHWSVLCLRLGGWQLLVTPSDNLWTRLRSRRVCHESKKKNKTLTSVATHVLTLELDCCVYRYTTTRYTTGCHWTRVVGGKFDQSCLLKI